MSGHKIDRINEDIKRELSAIFRTLKDPRISSMITVLRVDVTNDLSYATIHVRLWTAGGKCCLMWR